MAPENDSYRFLIENMPDAFAYHQIVTADDGTAVDYIFLKVNQAFEEMTGLKRDIIIGKKVTDVLPGIEKSEFDWIGIYGKVALSGEPVRFESFSEPLGRWYDVSAYSDKPEYFATVFRDFTESKNSEMETKKHQREMTEIKNIGLLASSTIDLETVLNSILKSTTNLINASVGMIFVKDLNSDLIMWGASHGLSEDFVNEFKVKPIHLGEGLTGIIAQTGESIYIQRDSSYDPRVMRSVIEKEGLNSFLGVPIFAEDKIIGVMNILTRIPDILNENDVNIVSAIASQVGLAIRNAQLYENQNKANADLLISEEKFRQVAESIGEVFWLRSADNSKMLYINPAYEMVWGRTVQSLYDNPQTFMDATYDADKPAVFAEFEKYVNGGKFDLEYRLVRPGGDIRWVRAQSFPVLNEDGTVIRHTGIAVDITELKQAEEEIRKLNEELEERVRNRTAQLEAANRELDAFAYSTSHDLRGPLNRISGFSKALLEDYTDQLDYQGKDYLQRISNSSQHLGELVDDLLKLSRVSQQQINREPVEISVLVNIYLKELQAREPDRQVEAAITPGLVVEGDTALLRIALENLLNNAWKFSAGKNPARIEFGSKVQEGKEVFYIRDNGTGFDMKHAEKLFTAFQRLHDAKTYPGTGIGLSIVSRIIKRHGGEIWARGEEGMGACFYFTCPKQGILKT
jgi:PAS domain S-box-containing protein